MTTLRVLDETVLTPSAAATVLHTTTRTVVRWLSVRVKLSDGRAVRLEGVRVGTLWKTSREACLRFAAETTAGPAAPAVRKPGDSRRETETAKKILGKWGINR